MLAPLTRIPASPLTTTQFRGTIASPIGVEGRSWSGRSATIHEEWRHDGSHARMRPDTRGLGILDGKGNGLFEPVRFLWNATRGYRLTPWRSPYLRWRVETFSGMKAETLTAAKVFTFMWEWRWELLRFLLWTGTVEQETRRKQG